MCVQVQAIMHLYTWFMLHIGINVHRRLDVDIFKDKDKELSTYQKKKEKKRQGAQHKAYAISAFTCQEDNDNKYEGKKKRLPYSE